MLSIIDEIPSCGSKKFNNPISDSTFSHSFVSGLSMKVFSSIVTIPPLVAMFPKSIVASTEIILGFSIRPTASTNKKPSMGDPAPLRWLRWNLNDLSSAIMFLEESIMIEGLTLIGVGDSCM